MRPFPRRQRPLRAVQVLSASTRPLFPDAVRDAWWFAWAAAAAGLFALGFTHAAVDIARDGGRLSIAPVAFLFGLVGYELVLGCIRRTSWLQARRVRRARRHMAS
jgi:hypothetical protein